MVKLNHDMQVSFLWISQAFLFELDYLLQVLTPFRAFFSYP